MTRNRWCSIHRRLTRTLRFSVIRSARIRVASNVPVAKLAVRMTEVTPEGKSWPVSYGLLNLTHRTSHEHPSALNVR